MLCFGVHRKCIVLCLDSTTKEYMAKTNIKVCGITSHFSVTFTKGHTFHDFLLAFLGYETFFKRGLPLKERICFYECKFFPLTFLHSEWPKL